MIFWYSQIEINSLIYVWISCIEKQWEINVSITNKEQDLHMQKKKCAQSYSSIKLTNMKCLPSAHQVAYDYHLDSGRREQFNSQ